MSALIRRGLQAQRRFGVRNISISAPLVSKAAHVAPVIPGNAKMAGASLAKSSLLPGVAFAGSPLAVEEFGTPGIDSLKEIQFFFASTINGMVEKMFESDCGPWYLQGVTTLILLRMFFYYYWAAPSYMYHFQERYGCTWTVGHHLYGGDIKNPLKK